MFKNMKRTNTIDVSNVGAKNNHKQGEVNLTICRSESSQSTDPPVEHTGTNCMQGKAPCRHSNSNTPAPAGINTKIGAHRKAPAKQLAGEGMAPVGQATVRLVRQQRRRGGAREEVLPVEPPHFPPSWTWEWW